MEKREFVKLSRPLFLREESGTTDKYIPVYGFELKCAFTDEEVHDYVEYLAGMHFWSNGCEPFALTYEYGLPDWVDADGQVHNKPDGWTRKIGKDCVKWLNLSYTVISKEMKRGQKKYLRGKGFVLDERFFES